MGNMVIGLMMGIGQIRMKRLEMAGSWICRIGEVMDTCLETYDR